MRIYLVDDDAQSLDSTRRLLELESHEVVFFQEALTALQSIRADREKGRPIDLIISDVRMPGMNGLEFLKAIQVMNVNIPFILMTAYGQVDDAVWAMKQGAVDFLMKPFKRPVLLQSMDQAVRFHRERVSVQSESSRMSEWSLGGLSESLIHVHDLISRVAPTEVNVLIVGESGVGKERAARLLHQKSHRSEKSFVGINCGAIPENLMESEFFGYEKGAFTGAHASKIGLFQAAHGGTLFLDEVAELPLHLQVKLLRVLQDREVRRVGATHSEKIDVRVIAATHRDLRRLCLEGKFREDLMFRLEVVEIKIPSLRERRKDIPALSKTILAELSEKHQKRVDRISEEVLKILESHDWPGNVRELANVLERALVLSEGGEILEKDLPVHLRKNPIQESSIVISLGTPLKDVEEILIKKTLEATQGDKQMTAKLLGINARTIYRKLERDQEADSEPASDSVNPPL